jgi:hypothetical protein
MILTRICWYLCGLFLVAEVFLSCISVTREGEVFIAIAMVTVIILAVISGLLAMLLSCQLARNPDSFIFRSKLISRAFIGIAAFLTLIVFFGSLG